VKFFNHDNTIAIHTQFQRSSQHHPVPSTTPQTTSRLTVGANAVICQETTLIGDVTIGSGTSTSLPHIVGCVIHPKVTIYAESGPIVIGKNNIIEENSIIVNKLPTPLIIGDENLFEVACRIEGVRIGNQNVFEAQSRVVGNTSIGNNCVVGMTCETEPAEQMADGTVVYGRGNDRRMQMSKDMAQIMLHMRHLEYLREIVPKYNHLRPLH
jgi:dynactin-6